MIDLKTVFRLVRLTALLAAGAALMAGLAHAEASRHGDREKLTQSVANAALPCGQTDSSLPSRGRPVATVSNGVTTSTIFNGRGGLEVSANAPGTITVTNGSNSITLPGNAVTLSGAIALAPGATPGVTVTPNAQGGYTVVRNTQCKVLADADLNNEIAGVGHLINECAVETRPAMENLGTEFDR